MLIKKVFINKNQSQLRAVTSAKATTDPGRDSTKDDKVLIRRRHVSCCSRIVHLSCPTRSLTRCQ